MSKAALRMGSEIERQRRKKDQHLARFEPAISSTRGIGSTAKPPNRYPIDLWRYLQYQYFGLVQAA